jgi:UDP:flavonoid glycosyltransferase YjiC (YdhE family)
MGSIKECIHLNVPMIISPLGIDQFENTKRVLHHGFGLELEIQNANINTTIKNILNLIRDKETRTRIEQMELLQKRDSVNNHWMEKLIPAN